MTLRFALLVVVALGSGLLAGCGDDENDERIAAPAPDFAVELPDGWEEQDAATREQAGEIGVEQFGDEAGIPDDAQFSIDVQALWTVTAPGDGFRTNVNVFSEKLPEGADLAQYFEFSLQQLKGTTFATGVGQPSEGPPVGGEPSRQVEYTASQQGVALRLRLVSVVREGSAYNVTLTATDDEFDEASADLDEIIASWSWN